MPNLRLIFFGTYTRTSPNQGIYAGWLDEATGSLSEPTLVATAADPAWLVISPDKEFLYAIDASPSQAIGFRINASNGQLTPLPRLASGGEAIQPPSHLAVDATGRVLLAANYREGFVASIPLARDGTLGRAKIIRHEGKGPNPERQDRPHVHSVTISPDNRFVIVADLGVDKIFSYALDPDSAQLTPAIPPFVATAPGAGPRHFKFSRDGHHAYAINELDSTVTAYRYDPHSGALEALHSVSTLPPDYRGASTTAEIRVHPNGRFVYGSNRGHDSIAVFAIGDSGRLGNAPIQIMLTGGKTPRNFALSPSGEWLVCGHQDSALITIFRVDPSTGTLTPAGQMSPAPSSVCIAFYD